MSEIKQRIENRNRLVDQLESTGGILDVGALYAGAQRAEEETLENQRKIRENAAARSVEKQKKSNEFMAKVSESVERKKKEKADLEFKKAKAEAEKELEAKIRNQNGLLSAEEEVKENAYSNMLNNLNKNK